MRFKEILKVTNLITNIVYQYDFIKFSNLLVFFVIYLYLNNEETCNFFVCFNFIFIFYIKLL